VWCADLDGDGGDEIIVGVTRPASPAKPNPASASTEPATTAQKWSKTELDPGGVAVEDLAIADSERRRQARHRRSGPADEEREDLLERRRRIDTNLT
jgi:hypothetical protein